jgi:hypothetical protein
LRRAITAAPFESAWNEAQHWQIDDAVREALSSRLERATA